MTQRLLHIGALIALGLCANLFGDALSGGMRAQAQMMDVPIPGPVDPRVKSVQFREDAVVALRGHYGYQMMVEFGTDERIENVSIGDSLAWQVTPNRRADTLFLKPIEFDASTNMSVVTSKRRYTFQLSAEEASGPGDPDIIYRVKFSFPPEIEATAETTPTPSAAVTGNTAYSVSGSVRNVPARIYDDGANTYLEWAERAATPAIFAVLSDGSEAVVNFIMRGNVMVVERVGPAFVLRNGSEETRIINNGWREATPGPQAPTMTTAPAPRRSWFGTRRPKAGQP